MRGRMVVAGKNWLFFRAAFAAAAFLLLLAASFPPASGADSSSSGYLIARTGEFSSAVFTVTPSATPENVPILLYFSDPALAQYFSLSSASESWNGNGFTGLSGRAAFSLDFSGAPPAALVFTNHTVWVEVAGVNRTVRFLPIPGLFLSRGRDPPAGVPVRVASRASQMEYNGELIPVEVSLLVW